MKLILDKQSANNPYIRLVNHLHMEITKIFTFEGSHVVRNCTSERCSHSVHGHSYKVEVTFEARQLDNAQMVYDFGLMKGTIKGFIDSMDHCHIICSADTDEYVRFFQNHNDRWIMVPFNPSAEMISVFIMRWIQIILNQTITNNGESKNLRVKNVTVWETATGRAKCDEMDVTNLFNELWIPQICFSKGVTKDWSKELKAIMLGNGQTMVANPRIKQQIDLKV